MRYVPLMLVLLVAVSSLLVAQDEPQTQPAKPADDVQALREEVATLRQQLAAMRLELESLKDELRLLRAASGGPAPVAPQSFSFELAGKVYSVVAPGPVKAGDVLAELDRSDLLLGLSEREERLRSNRNAVRHMTDMLNKARSKVTVATIELSRAEAEAERIRRLVDAGAAPRADLDKAWSVAARARSEKSLAEGQIRLYEYQVGEATKIIPELEADLAAHKAQLDKTRIIAPADGVVSAVHVARGATVEAGQAVIDWQPAK